MNLNRIPRIVHYAFGMAPDFGGKPWSLVHHICLLSVVRHIRPKTIILHYAHEPTGLWWELSKPYLTLHRIEAPQEIFGNKLCHVAHQAGIVRLQVLLEHGGIYLDADVLVQKSFDELLKYSTVMGIEGRDQIYGMADAVILAEPNAIFINRWYDTYRSFRSKGRDEFWAEHPVRMPAQLALAHPHEITVLPYDAFFWPLWTRDHLAWIYDSTAPIPNESFANHLWETVAWDHLSGLTLEAILLKDSNFHRWLLPYIDQIVGSLSPGATPFVSPPVPAVARR